MFLDFITPLSQIIAGDAGRIDHLTHARFVALCREAFLPPTAPRDFVEDFRATVLADPDRPKGTSLVHENGFTKISLWKFDNGCQLRLHIWPEAAFVDSRIHSHRWNLSSYCMEGALTALNYIEDPQAPPINTFRLDDEVNGRKESAFLARKPLGPGSVYTVTRGEGHYLHHAIMHRVSKPGGLRAITLMLSGIAQRDHSIISEADGFQAPQRQFMGADQIADALDAVPA